MVLEMPWPSLLMILKFSTVVLWPVVLSCSYIGDGAFKCSLNLYSKVLADSPIYSSSHSVLPHLYQYTMLLCFFISSLSFGILSQRVLLQSNIRLLINIERLSQYVSNVYYLRFLCYRINIIFSQWQAFAAYRSASSCPVENVLPINVVIKNIILYITMLLCFFISSLSFQCLLEVWWKMKEAGIEPLPEKLE